MLRVLSAKFLSGSLAWSLGLAAFLLSPSSHAARFANQFTEFELPPQWQCNLEGAEWVCQNTSPAKKRDAIIVLAAKLKGDQDSLDQYLTYLKAAKTYTSVQGKPVKSEVKYAKTQNINNHAWVDSLHFESEIPGFFTRYLATVKQDIGVLITYSISKNKWQEYSADFENMVRTLKVFRKSGGINTLAPSSSDLFKQAQVPTSVSESTVFQGAAPEGGSDTPAAPTDDELPLLPILLGAAAVGYLIWKRRQRAG